MNTTWTKALGSSLALACLTTGLWMSVGHSQTLPAPTEDRVNFPAGYDKWPVLYTFDRADNNRVLVVFANIPAFNVRFGQQGNYPYGSVIVMETWRALLDAQGNPVLDENGRFQKDASTPPTLNVMRKERGFGEGYGPNRNGEWEYGSYRTDGSTATAPQNTGICAQCHLQAGQGKDFIMRASLGFNNANGAVPTGVIKSYTFVPGVIRAKAGRTITIYNDDVVEHTIADDSQGGYVSERIRGGSSTTLRFTAPGEYTFHCSIHPAMKGRVIVEP